MLHVPVAGRAIDGAVLAHGRDDHPVGHRHVAHREGREEVLHHDCFLLLASRQGMMADIMV
jgi:metal-dependent hydrolase (beta-lactamase superfamily II)